MTGFFNSTFTWEVLCTGLAMAALGSAGTVIPVPFEPNDNAPSASEIESIADARMQRLRRLLTR